MRVLITWGSKRGGTEGIARLLGDALRAAGVDVVLMPAAQALRASSFDAVVVGGALYAHRWHPAARRFVRRREKWLRGVPVWFFSSGPLDRSAEETDIPPTSQVQALMERLGAQGHITFGGRLDAGARGFPAAAMAAKRAGDWRNPDRIRAWAAESPGTYRLHGPARPSRSRAIRCSGSTGMRRQAGRPARRSWGPC